MMRSSLTRFVAVLVVAGATLVAGQDGAVIPSGGAMNVDWPVYRGDAKGNQYSPLAQIHAANVHRLERAWEYRTGDANQRSTMHANPVVVDGVMYVTTPSLKAVALNAATGKEIWVFDPAKYNNGNVVRLRNRGVVHWKGTGGDRIFHFVRDRVYAVDAKTGALITTFGTDGFIDLRQNLGVDPASAVIEMTSPGAVYKNILIIASRVNESYDASPGHIRGYDTVTGAMKWIFHTIPKEGQFGHDTWKWVKGENYGGANAWGGVTIDEQRGWVFAATGSATDDFYGGFRKGDDLFANTVLALDALTGRAQVALPDRPPRHLGLRQPAGADPRHDRVRAHRQGCRRAADENGLHVRARSRHREAAVPRAGDPRAAIDGAGRGDLPDADRAAETAAARPAEPDRGRSDQHHAGGACPGLEGLPPLPVRADLHAAEPAGHDHDAGSSRRSGVAWRELRSGAQHALRQRQRGADDQPAAAACTTHPARPPTPLRWDARSTTARARPATARRARARRQRRRRSSMSSARRRRSRR